ncbi:MAG: protein of unknown function DUF881 [uncultured bacterium]|nr:MAG: protein of unknown function DUF881 [uncultured bacterium]
MFSIKDNLVILIVSLILGYVLAQQFFLQQRVKVVTQPDNSSSLAIEVSELIKNNAKLKKEHVDALEQLDKLNQSANNSIKANETIQENLTTYKTLLGIVPISGKGVIISLDEEIQSPQMIDLINAIKNIGCEAISINDTRIGFTSAIDNGTYYPPTTIKVIGDQELLADSLMRTGGIIDQIGNGNVEKKDIINLKAI